MGWYVMEMNGIPVIAHDGDTPTFHADMILIPAGQLGHRSAGQHQHGTPWG